MPQAAIAFIFYVNHYAWLNSNDVLFDLDSLRNWALINYTTHKSYCLPSLTNTLLSMTLSVGSILIGLLKGLSNWKATVAMVHKDDERLKREAMTRSELMLNYDDNLKREAATKAFFDKITEYSADKVQNWRRASGRNIK